MSLTHFSTNPSCPLNDPETAANPVLAGLQCTCDEMTVKDRTRVARELWQNMLDRMKELRVTPYVNFEEYQVSLREYSTVSLAVEK
jgi:hypothetical protein